MVRRFDPRPLPAGVLDRILESATHAPSAGFSQGLDLVVLEGPEAVAGFWQATADPTGVSEPFELGLRVSGRNVGEHRVRISREGVTFEPGSVDDLGTVIEFDPGSFVLTAFGRSNAGTIRGDTDVADRYLNLFFRI